MRIALGRNLPGSFLRNKSSSGTFFRNNKFLAAIFSGIKYSYLYFFQEDQEEFYEFIGILIPAYLRNIRKEYNTGIKVPEDKFLIFLSRKLNSRSFYS